MTKENGRFRKKRVNFSMVSNSIIRDSKISLKAKGLYALIQSYITIENFTLYKSFLMSKCVEGERAFNSAWQELKDTGYLKMYKFRGKHSKTFSYEYELLDVPELQDGHFEDLQNVGVQSEDLQNVDGTKQRSINNTVSNNTVSNNINRIISFEDVKEQIGLSDFSFFSQSQAQEIALLMQDVRNMPDTATIRVSGIERTAKEVKERFRLLDHFHVEYVIEAIKENTTNIRNKRSYLITALYNAPTTLETHYQNVINTGT